MNPTTSKPLLYLACPYSDSDPMVRHGRFEAACRAAAGLIRQCKFVFAPIVFSHPLCAHGTPLDWKFWEQQDRRFVELCDEVVVLTLDGWRESVGVGAEIAIARELGKPVSLLDPLANVARARVDDTMPPNDVNGM